MPKKKPHPLAILRYYATLVAAVIAIFSFFALLFLVPFVYDPTISTLNAGFSEQPHTCLLSQVRVGVRLSECEWTSCSEGCTAPNTNCIQLRVNVSHVPFHLFQRTPEFDTEHIWVEHEVPLRINIQGCGYPPRVNCTTFLQGIKKRVPKAATARTPVFYFDGDQDAVQATGRSARHVSLDTSRAEGQFRDDEPRALPSQVQHDSSPRRLTQQQQHFQQYLNVSFDLSLLDSFQIDWESMPSWWASVRAIVVALPADQPTLLPCYPSRAQPDMVITDYDHGQVLFQLVVSAVAPVTAFLLSTFLLCYCHAGCCKRNCPQLPIPEENDRMKMLPPDLVISRASEMNGN